MHVLCDCTDVVSTYAGLIWQMLVDSNNGKTRGRQIGSCQGLACLSDLDYPILLASRIDAGTTQDGHCSLYRHT